MAQRPSVQEILAAARSGSAPPARSVDAEASPAPKPAQEVPASTNPKPDSAPGSGMTLPQKLAAARMSSTSPAPTSGPRPTSSPTTDAPGRADRARSVSEKLAAARSGAVGVPARPPKSAARPAATGKTETPAPEAGPNRLLLRAVGTLLVGWGVLAAVAGGIWVWFPRGPMGLGDKTSRTTGVAPDRQVQVTAWVAPLSRSGSIGFDVNASFSLRKVARHVPGSQTLPDGPGVRGLVVGGLWRSAGNGG